MKKISTLFASLILAVAVFAADAKPKTMLTVKSAADGDIRVVLDGKRFEPNNNSFVIQDINSGRHDIEVYRQKNNGRIAIFGKRYELIYNTTVSLSNKTHLLINIDRSGRTTTQEIKLNGRNNQDRGGFDDRGYNYDRDGQWGGYDTHEGYAAGMNDREFSRVLQSIQKEWLESNKMKSASQIVKGNNLSVAQVKQMLLLFSFETNKLDLAKQAYANTVDKRNYSMLMDVFSFNSSKNELEKYIRNFR